MKLNFGCGSDIREGWENYDIKPINRKVKKIDLNKFPYKFKTNSVDEIFMSHVLEHLDDVEKTMNECVRILKPCGKITVIVPHFSYANSYSDITHKQFGVMNYHSLNKIKGLKVIKKRVIFGRALKWFEPLANKIPNIYQLYLAWTLPCREVYIEFRKLK